MCVLSFYRQARGAKWVACDDTGISRSQDWSQAAPTLSHHVPARSAFSRLVLTHSELSHMLAPCWALGTRLCLSRQQHPLTPSSPRSACGSSSPPTPACHSPHGTCIWTAAPAGTASPLRPRRDSWLGRRRRTCRMWREAGWLLSQEPGSGPPQPPADSLRLCPSHSPAEKLCGIHGPPSWWPRAGATGLPCCWNTPSCLQRRWPSWTPPSDRI